MRLLLVRHGETIWNVEQRLQGTTDVPLSERGRAQAAQLATRLSGETLAAIYTSDLARARETAEILAQPHGLPLRLEPRLREQSKGVWEGLTVAEVKSRFPDEVIRWEMDWDDAPEGAESAKAVVARIEAALESIRAAHQEDDRVLIVSHGMALRTLICVALGLEPGVGFQLRTGNAALSELEFNSESRTILARLNDQCHLDERK